MTLNIIFSFVAGLLKNKNDKKGTNIKRESQNLTDSDASAHEIYIKEEYIEIEEPFPVIEESLTDVSESKIEDKSTEDPLSKDNLGNHLFG